MRKILILQHVGHEPLGTLNPMLKAAGFRIRYVNFGRDPGFVPTLDGYSGLIVLGGPMGVYEKEAFPHLKIEMQLIEAALKKEIPVLGICLGAQLIASVLGGSVKKAPNAEVGWHELQLTQIGAQDPLFHSYAKSEKVFQLHQDTFDLPKDARHLARSPMFEGQAFRYGEKVYGLQFHLEVDQPMITRWMQRPENKRLILEAHGHSAGEAQIAQDTKASINRSLQLSAATFTKFIDIFKLPERPVLLGTDHAKPERLD